MKATVSVVCYKHKVLSNGESPLMVRIAKDSKHTMKSLGIFVNPVNYYVKVKNYYPNILSDDDIVAGYIYR